MKLYDQHVHSIHSHDSSAEPGACAQRAVELGLGGLTFTEHYDTNPAEAANCRYDDEEFSRTIAQLRAQYGSALWIGKGVEVDYQPAQMAAILDFLGRHSFDVVLLAVHHCHGEPVFEPWLWQERDPDRVARGYLETVLEALAMCEQMQRGKTRVFDVLAHLDFAKRYSIQYTGSDHVSAHRDLMEEILRLCLRLDMTLELNTSTLRKGFAEGMPGKLIMRRYAELGGTAMCLGSDSHRCEEIGTGLDSAVQMLLAAGIEQTAVFRQRVRSTERIDG